MADLSFCGSVPVFSYCLSALLVAMSLSFSPSCTIQLQVVHVPQVLWFPWHSPRVVWLYIIPRGKIEKWINNVVRKFEGKRPFRRWWEDIKMHFGEEWFKASISSRTGFCEHGNELSGCVCVGNVSNGLATVKVSRKTSPTRFCYYSAVR